MRTSSAIASGRRTSGAGACCHWIRGASSTAPRQEARMSTRRPAVVERSVRLLAWTGIALFVVTISSLFAVQGSMSAQQRKLEEEALPVQQRAAELSGWIAAAFAREVVADDARDEAELDRLGDRGDIERGLSDALARLGA